MRALPTEHRITGREFNTYPARAKEAARQAPVIILDRDKPAFVLLSHAAYESLAGSAGGVSLADRLRDDGPDADFDFEPPKARGPEARQLDL